MEGSIGFSGKKCLGVKYLPSIQFVHLRKIKMYFYLWFFDRQNLSEVSHKWYVFFQH